MVTTKHPCNPSILRMYLLWPDPPARNDKFWHQESSLLYRAREWIDKASEQLRREPGGLQRFKAGNERINASFDRAVENRVRELLAAGHTFGPHILMDALIERCRTPRPLPMPGA